MTKRIRRKRSTRRVLRELNAEWRKLTNPGFIVIPGMEQVVQDRITYLESRIKSMKLVLKGERQLQSLAEERAAEREVGRRTVLDDVEDITGIPPAVLASDIAQRILDSPRGW